MKVTVLLKFIYSEKATKFCENFTLLLSLGSQKVKSPCAFPTEIPTKFLKEFLMISAAIFRLQNVNEYEWYLNKYLVFSNFSTQNQTSENIRIPIGISKEWF